MLYSSPQYKALLYRKQALIEERLRPDNQAMIDAAKNRKRSHNEELAKKIQSAIEQSSFTAKQIADECGVSPQAVNGWKSTGRISKETLGTLARLLDIPLSHFMGAENDALAEVPPLSDVITVDEVLDLINAYKMASKIERISIMNLAKTAAKRASRRNNIAGGES